MSESETNKPVELDVEHARRLTARFKPIQEASEAIAQRVYEEIVPKVDPLRARQVEGLLRERDAARSALARATALLKRLVDAAASFAYDGDDVSGKGTRLDDAIRESRALLAAPAPAK